MNSNLSVSFSSYNTKMAKAGLQFFRYIVACLIAVFGYILILNQYFGENKDWSVYSRYYDYFISGWGGLLTQVEPVFHLIFSITSSLHIDLLNVLGGIALVSLLMKFFVITKISRSIIPVILYSAAMYPLHEYTQIRVALAIALCYLYLILCTKYKKTSFVLLCIIPFTHTSCLLFVLCCIASKKLYKFTFAKSFLLSLFALILISISIQFVAIVLGSSNLVNYLAGDIVDKKPVVLSITNIIFFLYSISFILTGIQYKDRGIYIASLLSIIAVPLAIIFYAYPVLADRFKELFFAFGVITFAYLLRFFKFTPKYLFAFLLYLLFCASSVFVYLNNGLLFR
ncbi:EpsG family protein [Klebsiella quasipneumoniae]|uniref:EpsG family protein n=1 Tax=Klebsiella quasipneumoniae TaxID=1463165 RepID=UPI002ABC4B7F|nr:EpsG family protein [Klebsiella quasipneumoniae]MDZ2013956.1 EpsG family protein [Klebsiella quasipneumoniae]